MRVHAPRTQAPPEEEEVRRARRERGPEDRGRVVTQGDEGSGHGPQRLVPFVQENRSSRARFTVER